MVMKFDYANPDEKLVRQVLYQAFSSRGSYAPTDIYGEAWCLRDMDLPDWKQLLKYLTDNYLVEESGEPGYYKLTEKGNEYSNRNVTLAELSQDWE